MSAEPHGAAEMVPSGWDLSGAGIPPVDIFILRTDRKKDYKEKINSKNKVTQRIYLHRSLSSTYEIKRKNAIQSRKLK